MENNTPTQNSYDNNLSQETQKSNETILKALKKLDAEAESVSGQNLPAIGIYHMIRAKVTEDISFAQCILNKKLSACFFYVMEQYKDVALDMAKGTGTRDNPEIVGIGASSDEIFDFVVDFYTLTDEELKKRTEEKAAKRKAKIEAEKKAQQEKAQEEAKAKKEEKEKREKEKKQKEIEKKKADELAEQGQISLY